MHMHESVPSSIHFPIHSDTDFQILYRKSVENNQKKNDIYIYIPNFVTREKRGKIFSVTRCYCEEYQ